MLENYYSDFINVMQVANLIGESGMTPKAVIRLAAENKLNAYVEGNFRTQGQSIEHCQPVKKEVLFDILAQYDEKLERKLPETNPRYSDIFDNKPPFGIEIIDSPGPIEHCTPGITGFHPHEFLLKVSKLRTVLVSDRYPSSKNKEGKSEKDCKVLIACLAETLRAHKNGTIDEFFDGNEFISSRLSKLLDENANAHKSLTGDTGERVSGTSETSIRRTLDSVTETYRELSKK